MPKPVFKRLTYILSIAALGLIAWCCLGLYGFLAISHRKAEAQVLVVEGWLPRWALEEAAFEFQNYDYEMLITTGGEYSSAEYRMGFEGELVWNLPEGAPSESDTAATEIIVKARGTPMGLEYPHFCLVVNDSVIGETFTQAEIQNFHFQTNLAATDLRQIVISYDNDARDDHFGDRDLFISSVQVADEHMSPFLPEVLYRYKLYEVPFTEARGPTYAAGSAYTLNQLGVDPARVAIAPATNIRKHRTPESAKAFHNWMQQSGKDVSAINVFTLGTHARRSRDAFRKVLGSSLKIGVISVKDPRFDSSTWWKTRKGFTHVWEEFFKYIFEIYLS